jgi:glycosyltransferase involved in cell wall biosynthesis
MEAVSQIDCKLLIVGSFVDDAYFKEYAKKLKLGKKVLFIGKVPHEKLPDYYNAADVFCVPSTIFEGQGIVFIEAMACGKPIVSTKVSAIMDTVGDAGIFVPLEDSKALAGALKLLKANPSLRVNLGKKALIGSKAFSEPIVLRKYLAVLEG